jgi:hypothetical protein
MAKRRLVVGVMGAGRGARPEDVERAELLGELIAREGFVLLTGGRPVGVMAAANRGAKHVPASLTLGVSPARDDAEDGNDDLVDIEVFTGMGDGRNVINVLSSDVVVACGAGGAGTASEVALALKSKRPVVLLAPTSEASAFFRSLGTVHVAETPEDVIAVVRELTRQ